MPERGVVGCVGSVVFPVALAAIVVRLSQPGRVSLETPCGVMGMLCSGALGAFVFVGCGWVRGAA